MNISKYIGKTFPAGKTAEELGIDTSKKFVVVNKNNKSEFSIGDVLKFDRQDGYEEHNPKVYLFRHENSGLRQLIGLEHLAYLEEDDENEKRWIDGQSKGGNGWAISGLNKPYEPRLGDKVRKDGVITSVCGNGGCAVGFSDDTEVWFDPKETSDLTLISRAPRTLTKAEAEKMLSEHLNESITII